MASDLIARHYRYSASSHILHPPLTEFPPSLFYPTPTTCFTLYNNTPTGAKVRRKWLFINIASGSEHNPPIDYHQKLAPFLLEFEEGLTVTVNDRHIVPWAWSQNIKHKVDTHMLYEMARPASPSIGVVCEELAIYDEAGFDIVEDPKWFQEYKPEEETIVTQGSERVYTMVEKDSGERAAFLTLAVEGNRGYISALMTFPKFRRRGLAKGLINYVIVSPWGEGKKRMLWLTVFSENLVAVNLYHNLEFETNRCLWVVTLDKMESSEQKTGS